MRTWDWCIWNRSQSRCLGPQNSCGRLNELCLIQITNIQQSQAEALNMFSTTARMATNEPEVLYKKEWKAPVNKESTQLF